MTAQKIDMKGALAAASQIKETAAALRAKRTGLAGQQDELRAANTALYRQRLTRADAKALLLLSIDRWAEEFLQTAWTPVLKDYMAPPGPRPQTLGAQNEKWDRATAKITAAQARLTHVTQQLDIQDKARRDALAKADRGEPYERPPGGTFHPEDKDMAERALRDAKEARAALQQPGGVSFATSTFASSQEPIYVQDAVAILDGGHTRMFVTDGFEVIDSYRNIFTGVMPTSWPLLSRHAHAQFIKAVCFFMGDAIKAKVEKHFDAAVDGSDEVEAALLSLEDCRAEIASNEALITQLGREISEIDSQLSMLASGAVA